MKKFVFPVAIISMIIIAILMMSWCNEKKQEQEKICNHEDNIDQLNCIISEKEKEKKEQYSDYHQRKSQIELDIKNASVVFSWYLKIENELQDLYNQKRNMFSWYDTTFSADRE
jgi:hypothetical protein